MNDLTLFLDTTTSTLMLALGNSQGLLAAQSIPCDSHRYHSALMIPAIEELLDTHGYNVSDLKALAVNTGPGSFTGIRTGIITARTMAQFMHLPVHAFNTFELLAVDYDYPVAIYLDALRGRAYHATLCWGEEGPQYWRQPPRLVSLHDEIPNPPMQARLLVSAGLTPFFPWAKPGLIDADFFTPLAMMKLMDRFGSQFIKPWTDLLPLYLQSPSITLKKTPPLTIAH